jgi:PKD repeat protein
MALTADFVLLESSRVGDNSNYVIFSDYSFGTIDSYKWIMGDGTVYEGAVPMVYHTYTLPGKYTVTLVVQNATEQASITKQDYVIVNDVRAVPNFVIMQSYDISSGDYWRFYVDEWFHLVFETPQYVYRSKEQVLDVKKWSLVQFDFSSEKMYWGSYAEYFREIECSKLPNTSPVVPLETKSEIAYCSLMKLDELMVWSSTKDLKDYYKGTRGRAGYLA